MQMKPTDSEPDELQSLWLKDNPKPTEDYSMLLRIVQEKQHTLQEFLRGEDSANYLLALCFAPLTALCIWMVGPHLTRHYSYFVRMIQLGFLLMTLTLIASAVATWINHRKVAPLLKCDLSVREHQLQLLNFYDAQIRCLKSIKFWFGIPLLAGASMALYPVVHHYLHQPWSTLMIAAIFVTAEYFIWRASDVQGVKNLQRRKDEMQGVLDEMERI
jgi:hypothetical protein